MIGWFAGLWLFAAAWAQEQVSEEVIVTGRAVEQAREAVIEELVDLGYDRVFERDGRLVLKHHDTWKGKVVLYDDGYLKHRRQGFRVVEGPAKELPKGTRWLPCVVVPTACVQSGLGVGGRKLDGQKGRTMAAVEPRLIDLSERVADAAVAQTLDVLPGRLDALWAEGEPLEGGPPVGTFRARRAEIAAFWASRTETRWGQEVKDAVRAFVSGVVQPSDHPYTAAERRRWPGLVR